MKNRHKYLFLALIAIVVSLSINYEYSALVTGYVSSSGFQNAYATLGFELPDIDTQASPEGSVTASPNVNGTDTVTVSQYIGTIATATPYNSVCAVLNGPGGPYTLSPPCFTGTFDTSITHVFTFNETLSLTTPGTYCYDANVTSIIGLVTEIGNSTNHECFTIVPSAPLNGSITIVKHTTPAGSSQQFNFTSDLGNFTLSDGQNATFTAAPGTFNFTELVPSGWNPNPIRVCLLNGSNVSFPGPSEVTVNLAAGSHVVCTFYNVDQHGTITIVKHTEPAGSSQQFNFTGDLGNFTLGDGQNFTKTVLPGNYTIQEILPTGWKIHILGCAVKGTGSSIALSGLNPTFKIGDNGTGICTFTNQDIHGHITIVKHTEPAGSSQQFKFTGDLGNFTLGDGQNFTKTVLPGNYTVQEIIPTGWKAHFLICFVSNNKNHISFIPINGTIGFNISDNGTVKCDLTNQDILGQITIIKHTDPAGSSQQFKFTGDLGNFTLSDGQNFTKTVLPGNYTVQEIIPTGWKAQFLKCFTNSIDNHISFDLNGTIGFKIGDNGTVKCELTNQAHQTIIVEKRTIPAASPGSFTFTGDVSGTISDGGKLIRIGLLPGNYSAIESISSTLKLTGIVCNDTNSIGNVTARKATFVLDPNEIVKCTFTNTNVITVSIDIKPQDSKNTISINNDQSVRVAILGSTAVPVNLIDISPLSTDAPRFGGSTPQPPTSFTIQDVNGDKKPDLVLKYNEGPKNPLGFKSGDTQGCITGKLLDGTIIQGCDKVRIIK